MLIFHNPDHALHQPRQEMFRGRLVPCHESPARLHYVMAELQRRPVGTLREPGVVDEALLRRVHAPRYLDFLSGAWDEWVDRANPPQRACIGVTLADRDLVEILVTAAQ